jgi:histone H3/H4
MMMSLKFVFCVLDPSASKKLLVVVDKLARNERARGVSTEYVQCLCEALKEYAVHSLIPDLVAFAAHAKRRTVNVDDVRLAARRSAALLAHLSKFTSTSELDAKSKTTSKVKRQRRTILEDDNDPNEAAAAAAGEDEPRDEDEEEEEEEEDDHEDFDNALFED